MAHKAVDSAVFANSLELPNQINLRIRRLIGFLIKSPAVVKA